MPKEIALTNGMVALVDDDDFPWLSAFRWSAIEGRRGAFYATRMAIVRAADGTDGTKRSVCRQMQRDILDPEMTLPGLVKSDHINHDTLDNRRENLRLVDARVSALNRRLYENNTSGFRGVYFERRDGTYYAQLGSFWHRYVSKGHRTAEDAASAYNWLALRHHGEHAQLNVGKDGRPLPARPYRYSLQQMGLDL